MIPSAQHFALAEGDAGTAFTIARMVDLVDEGKGTAEIRACALEILNQKHIRAFDREGAARAIYSWVLGNITFTPDPVGIEGVQSAAFTLKYRRGDCDCISVLMCALLESVGIRCRFITVASDPTNPDLFSHVYPEALLSGKWVSVDAARRHPAFGLSPSRFFRKRGWSLRDASFYDFTPEQTMSGLGILPAAPMPMHLPARRTGLPLYYNPPPARLRRRLTGLGQDNGGVDWQSIAQLIQSGSTGAANIIAASRATPYNLYPTTYAPIGGAGAPGVIRPTPLLPAGQFLGLPPWVWVVGLGVAAIAALRR
jgi:hypothetical protein